MGETDVVMKQEVKWAQPKKRLAPPSTPPPARLRPASMLKKELREEEEKKARRKEAVDTAKLDDKYSWGMQELEKMEPSTQISVKTLTGKNIALAVKACNTIETVKAFIMEHMGTSPGEQVLAYDDVHWHTTTTFSR